MKKKRLIRLLQELKIDLECFKSHCNASRKRIVMLESQVHTLCRQFDTLEEDAARINERLAIMDGDVKLPQLFDDPDDTKILLRSPQELEVKAAEWAAKYKVEYADDDFNEYGEDVK